jgi:hypothetical protein
MDESGMLNARAAALLAALPNGTTNANELDAASLGRWVESERPARWSSFQNWVMRRGSRWENFLPLAWTPTPRHYMAACNMTLGGYVRYQDNMTEWHSISTADDELVHSAMDRLAGRTLLFSGDSIDCELFLATVCWFRDAAQARGGAVDGPAVEALDIPGASNHSVELTRYCASFGVAAGRPRSALVRLCYTRAILPTDVRAHAMSIGRTGVIVLSLSINLLTERSFGLAARVRWALASQAAAIDSIPAGGRPGVVFREASPQHFPSTSSAVGEYTRAGHGGASQVYRVGQKCMPYDRASNRINRLADAVLLMLGFPVVRLWRESLWRWQDHFEWTHTFTRSTAILDCTHWCLASGVLDRWVVLLMQQVLAL